MKAVLIEKIQESSDVVSFVFNPEKPLNWQAGQYFYCKLDHQNADNRGPIRHFTIASAPYEKNIMLTTKFTEDKISSFKQALKNLPVSGSIDIFSIDGKFTLKNTDKKYIFIAGGIGITPFRSILFDLDHNNSLNEIFLFYANRNEETVFKDQLDKLAQKHRSLKIQYVISPRKIDLDLIKNAALDFSEYIFYVSGSEGFVKGIKEKLLETGINRGDIMSDYFPGYQEEI